MKNTSPNTTPMYRAVADAGPFWDQRNYSAAWGCSNYRQIFASKNVLMQWTAAEGYISKEINKKRRSENYFGKVIVFVPWKLLCVTLCDRSDYMQSYIGSELPHTWCRYQHKARAESSWTGISAQFSKKFRTFYRGWTFITVFRRFLIRP